MIVTLISAVLPLSGQGLEASGFAGYGSQAGDDQQRTGKAVFGGSFGWQSAARSGFIADYAYADFDPRIYQRHWLTGSYRLQASQGTARPFFQAGLGAMWTRVDLTRVSGAPQGLGTQTETDLAIILGAGMTIHIHRSFFVRPQLRTYWYAGPTMLLAPCVAVGFTF